MGRIAPTLRANAAGATVPWWKTGAIYGIRTARFFVPNPWWAGFANPEGNSPAILLTRLNDAKWFVPRAQPGLNKPTFVFVEAQCHNIADSSSIFDFIGAFVRLCQSFGYPRLPDPWRQKAADIFAALTVSDEEFPSPTPELVNNTQLVIGIPTSMQSHMILRAQTGTWVTASASAMSQQRGFLWGRVAQAIAHIMGVPTVDLESMTVDADWFHKPGDIRHSNAEIAHLMIKKMLVSARKLGSLWKSAGE